MYYALTLALGPFQQYSLETIKQQRRKNCFSFETPTSTELLFMVCQSDDKIFFNATPFQLLCALVYLMCQGHDQSKWEEEAEDHPNPPTSNTGHNTPPWSLQGRVWVGSVCVVFCCLSPQHHFCLQPMNSSTSVLIHSLSPPPAPFEEHNWAEVCLEGLALGGCPHKCPFFVPEF